MNKKLILSITIVGCDKQLIDTKFSFTIDGITYLVHSSNVTLMSKMP